MTDEEIHLEQISDDLVRTLVQSENVDEIAEVLDQIMDPNVYKGYNDNDGLYLER